MEKCYWYNQDVAALSQPAIQLTCSNSSMSTSPSPFKSNILKAISKFLWGAALKKHDKKRPVKENMQDQNKAGVTSSEWRHSKVAFNNAFLKEETALRNLYKCHGAAFSKGLDTEVGGKEMFLEKKSAPFRDGKGKKAKRHLILVMSNHKQVTP